jgi:hypothetical protein
MSTIASSSRSRVAGLGCCGCAQWYCTLLQPAGMQGRAPYKSRSTPATQKLSPYLDLYASTTAFHVAQGLLLGSASCAMCMQLGATRRSCQRLSPQTWECSIRMSAQSLPSWSSMSILNCGRKVKSLLSGVPLGHGVRR